MEMLKSQTAVTLNFDDKKYYDADTLLGQKFVYLDLKKFNCNTIELNYQFCMGLYVVGNPCDVVKLLNYIHSQLSAWYGEIKKYIELMPKFTDLEDQFEYLWEKYDALGGADQFGAGFEYADIEDINKQLVSSEIWLSDLAKLIKQCEA